MTGFGEASGATAAGTLRVELRTVNHRYLNLNARLPSALARWEGELREWVRAYFARGHVNCTARWEANGSEGAAGALRLDADRVREYLRLFHELSETFELPGSPDLALLSRYNDIFVRGEEEGALPEIDPAELRVIVEAAAAQAQRMREEEGRRLELDLRERLAAIRNTLEQVAAIAPQRISAEQQRLAHAIAELTGGLALDPARLAQEVALLADRWDLNEELVRFRSHLELFTDLLEQPATEPVGKRLSFLVQEMNREANTIGAKANHAGIAHLVVTLKDELEKVREQVENVE